MKSNVKRVLVIIKIFFKNFIKSMYELTIDNTRLIEISRKKGVKIGENCRLYSANFGSEPYLISIGNHVTITNGVHFITHDGGVWIFREERLPEADIVGPIVIEDNCFIGVNAIILPNVTIGKNSIVAAGSVVTKSIPMNSVVAGVPAKIIKNSQQYLDNIESKIINVKNLSPKEKRKILEDKYNRS